MNRIEKDNNSTEYEIDTVSGDYIDLDGERYYVIRNVDHMKPFFVSVVSDSDHWLFVSSNGGVTAGRVSAESALLPYVTVDKIHDSPLSTGSRTLLRVHSGGNSQNWEPFNQEHYGYYKITRNLYKNTLGNKISFEEVNHDLQLVFRYTWANSDEFGFIRTSHIENTGNRVLSIELIDGLQNILAANTPLYAQTNYSNLVDAYKWTELDEASGLALYALYSGITDRAEPCESLKANTVFCLGLEGEKVLISSDQLGDFRQGYALHKNTNTRGTRGAYLVNYTLALPPNASQQWLIAANVSQTQAQVVKIKHKLEDTRDLQLEILESIKAGTDRLERIIAKGDGFQLANEENVCVHHYANVLFNTMRGGMIDDAYQVSSRDFSLHVENYNNALYKQYEKLLTSLPRKIDYNNLLLVVRQQNNAQLERICNEYLPITFARRHGDPSRPWNRFSINLKDAQGNRLLSYEGNWRDIFQNWEALVFSYPEYIDNIIARFVNASTIDGYNPYRITNKGIEWEIEDPEDPWSYIGYWGDHQIIYLLKLLEFSSDFYPNRLSEHLRSSIYSYANVPYRIKPLEAMLDNAKSTVEYDHVLDAHIDNRVQSIGADGKLLHDASGQIYLVNLLEKLLVPLLSKLGNLVIDGGIWLNTQRPEWNDANNALVGQGLSMVTLYYLRRYIAFMQQLLCAEKDSVAISTEVVSWLDETSASFKRIRGLLVAGQVSDQDRYQSLLDLGHSATRYRLAVYQHGFSGKQKLSLQKVRDLLQDAIYVVDESINNNVRHDGLYHSYNLLDIRPHAVTLDRLYPMLEGQVAVLSSGAIPPQQAVTVLESLFASDMYRQDQNTFMLYPDRQLPGFLEKNLVTYDQVESIPLLQEMRAAGDEVIVLCDDDGNYRFNADLNNVAALNAKLDHLVSIYGESVDESRAQLQELYETVFNHQAFTGRSGGMFGFEGLGCVYWHMVSKLLLATQENFFSALDAADDTATTMALGRLYYRIRDGIGFNKRPDEYGAFPTDPYSHTPKHAGAQQPGMTGQVKEEILTRFGELGVRVRHGEVAFCPALLRRREFSPSSRMFRYLDVDDNWQALSVPAKGVAFTWCQVPVIYKLEDSDPSLTITWSNGEQNTIAGCTLSAETGAEILRRSGRISSITLVFRPGQLFEDNARVF